MMLPQSNSLRFGTVVVSILAGTLIAGCANTVPIQSASTKAKAVSALRVGDRIKYAYETKDGWGENGCHVTAIDDVGFTCYRQPDKVLFDHVTSITHPSKLGTAALIPVAPVFVVGWMAECMFSCGSAGGTNEHCPITETDIEASRKTTKLVEVTELPGPIAKYKSDGDPDTLELVFLKNPKDGPSRVMDDGEVVVLMPTSDDEIKQALVTRALYVRTVLRKGLTKQCVGPWTR